MTTTTLVAPVATLVLQRPLPGPEPAPRRPKLATSIVAIDYLTNLLSFSPVEQMWLVTVNGKNEVGSVVHLFSGGLNECMVCVPTLLRAVLADPVAAAFILVHNHPSGSLEPSYKDIETTRRIKQAAETVGLQLLDHVLIAWNEEPQAISMLAKGVFPT